MKLFTRFILVALFSIPSVLIAQIPFANFFTADTAICQFQFVPFSDLSSNGPTIWKWSFPGGIPDTSTQQTPPAIQYDSPGYYSVKLLVENVSGVDSTTKTKYIHVYSPPHVVITGPTVLCDENSAEICATGGNQYTWNTGQTTSCINIEAIEGIAGLTYTVQVTNGACFKDTSYTVIFDTCLGIPGISALPQISIYPNPANSFLTVKIEKPIGESTSLSIIDITGRELISQKINPSQSLFNIDVSSLAPSIYFLKIQTDEGILVKKFVKE
jgi:PKD repeat protein